MRAAEALGVCLLGACAVATPLLVMLWWRQTSDVPTGSILGVIAIGWLTAAGAIALRRWPSVMSAAAEADRQLHLAELLATALVMESNHPAAADVMAVEVLAMADARCRQLLPSSVVLHRLGARTWGGIGLSTALVITLAIMPARPGRSDASSSADEALALSNPSAAQPDRPIVGAPTLSQQSHRIDPSSDDASRISFDTNATNASSSATPRNPANGSSGGASGGLAKSESRSSGLQSQSLARNAQTSDSSRNGTAAGGGNPAAANAQPGDAPRGAVAAQFNKRAVAPWSADGLPPSNGIQSPAESHDAAGGIPAQYHDMVRAYFERN